MEQENRSLQVTAYKSESQTATTLRAETRLYENGRGLHTRGGLMCYLESCVVNLVHLDLWCLVSKAYFLHTEVLIT